MVEWAVMATLYGEVHSIDSQHSDAMPSIGSFGLDFENFFRSIIAAVGNYDELYQRNLGELYPRGRRNVLNKNPQMSVLGPNVYIPPGLGL